MSSDSTPTTAAAPSGRAGSPTEDGGPAGAGHSVAEGLDQPSSEVPGAAAGTAGTAVPSGRRRTGKVAIGCPFRVHVLVPTAEVPAPTPADCPAKCTRQHVVHGQTYRYCTCGLSKAQVRVWGRARKTGRWQFCRFANWQLKCPHCPELPSTAHPSHAQL